MNKITKAIFPVAGLGTRFLPATKASPKEMLPVVDKPLIQYAAEEAIKAGITDLIFITGRNKRSIEDHFDKAYELENELQLKNKLNILKELNDIVPAHVNCIYIRQPEALGLGHAIMCAKPVIGDEPFAIILADELIDATPNALQQMLEIHNKTGKSVLGVNQVSPELISSYGIVKLSSNLNLANNKIINPNDPHSLLAIYDIIEKPKAQEAPSNLAVIGRYILTPQIFNHLAKIKIGVGHEIQLTDAIKELLGEEQVYASLIQGMRYDCGSKLGYLKATVGYALKHKEISKEFTDYLKSIL